MLQDQCAMSACSRRVQAGRCLEEVFEHERYSPIFAFGHRYPGHFLPTDRVGHWGTRAALTPSIDTNDFFDVAPRLEQVLLTSWRGEDMPQSLQCS